jgi:tetratricopeptide (TPR) repeat protein
MRRVLYAPRVEPEAEQRAPEPESATHRGEPGQGDVVDGRYRLEAILGRGGMGCVYSAHDAKLGRSVAIKLLAASRLDEAGLRRFRKEARTVSSLSHPNIVTVFDDGMHEGVPYLATELLKGETLRQRLERGALPLEEATRLARQMAAGLQAAHERGVVHRDLKPDNVFLCAGGLLKLLDFGIAKLLAGSEALAASPKKDATTTSDTGHILGTPGYMSPEQVRSRPQDQRSDVFSFGLVLYEMLSGKRAFQRDSAVETAYSILTAQPPALPGQVPAPLRALVSACLQKEPSQRPDGFAQVVAALDGAPLPNATRVGWRRRRAGVLTLAAGLVAVAAFWLWRTGPAPTPSPHGEEVVAVLPFRNEGSPRLEYLREGAASLLGRALSSGPARVVEPQALLRYASRTDAGAGAELAARFGATSYIEGELTGDANRFTLRVRLVALKGEEAGRPLADASVDGTERDLLPVVEQVAARLRDVGQAHGRLRGHAVDPARDARVGGTASLEALKSYLEGEAMLRRSDWAAAIRAFSEAVRVDPGFTLAQYSLAVAAGQRRDPKVAEQALDIALRDRARLSPRDAALLEAYASFQSGRAAEADKRYRALVYRSPGEVEAWTWLGELAFHYGPLRGRSASEAGEPFRHVIMLDPFHGGALLHLVDVAQIEDHRELVQALADRYLSSTRDEASMLPVRWTQAWAAGDVGTRRELLERFRAEPELHGHALTTFLRALWQHDGFSDARALAEVLAQHPDPELRARGLECLAVVEAGQGRPAHAREWLLQASALGPRFDSQASAAWLDTLSFFPAPPDGPRRRPPLEHADQQWQKAKRAYLLGMLAVRSGDAALAEARLRDLSQVESKDGSLQRDLVRSLRARLELLAGKPRVALSTLESMELEIPYYLITMLGREYDLLLQAELNEALGQPDRALSLTSSWTYYLPASAVFFAPVAERRARLFEAQGQAAEAAAEWRRFVTLWANAEPALQSRVQEAERRLRALSAPAH